MILNEWKTIHLFEQLIFKIKEFNGIAITANNQNRSHRRLFRVSETPWSPLEYTGSHVSEAGSSRTSFSRRWWSFLLPRLRCDMDNRRHKPAFGCCILSIFYRVFSIRIKYYMTVFPVALFPDDIESEVFTRWPTRNFNLSSVALSRSISLRICHTLHLKPRSTLQIGFFASKWKNDERSRFRKK